MSEQKKHLTGIKAIFFDAGGTLLYPYPSVGDVYAHVADQFGVKTTSDQINKIFSEVWDNNDGLTAGLTSEKSEKDWWREIVRQTFEPIGKFKDFEAFFNNLYVRFANPETWKLYEETDMVLARLQMQGYKLGLISNWDSRLIQLCDVFEISPYFDFMLVSAIFGKAKPDREIFAEAVKRAGVNASECLHIGDSLEDDVHGALDAGLRAIWLNRHERKEKFKDGFSVVHNLRELLA